MRKLIIIFIFLSIKIQAQKIDSTFIAKHTYESLEEAFKNPDEVFGLNIRDKKLEDFPKAIFKFIELRKLDIGFNNILELPKEIYYLTHLKELNINSNKLYTLPDEIGLLNKLENLEV